MLICHVTTTPTPIPPSRTIFHAITTAITATTSTTIAILIFLRSIWLATWDTYIFKIYIWLATWDTVQSCVIGFPMHLFGLKICKGSASIPYVPKKRMTALSPRRNPIDHYFRARFLMTFDMEVADTKLSPAPLRSSMNTSQRRIHPAATKLLITKFAPYLELSSTILPSVLILRMLRKESLKWADLDIKLDNSSIYLWLHEDLPITALPTLPGEKKIQWS